MAMACRFELILYGEDRVRLRAAGEAALDEIERIESRLTIFDPASEVSRLNARAALESVRVSTELFDLLTEAKRLHAETGGTFDLTIAPLMRAWGFFRDTGHLPDQDVLEKARSLTGMELVELDESDRSVRFRREGVMLDFGAIGKGYAVDEAIAVLCDAGIRQALLHGGTSTMFGLGAPPEEHAWKIAVPRPDREDDPLAVVELRDESLSVSAVWGKAFEANDRTYGHVLDPRAGHPVDGGILAAVVAASATESDALSTALLVSPECAEASDASSQTGTPRGTPFQSDAEYGNRALAVVSDQNKPFYRVVEFGLTALPSARQTPLHPPSTSSQ